MKFPGKIYTIKCNRNSSEALEIKGWMTVSNICELMPQDSIPLIVVQTNGDMLVTCQFFVYLEQTTDYQAVGPV
jgi:hypothetical protein